MFSCMVTCPSMKLLAFISGRLWATVIFLLIILLRERGPTETKVKPPQAKLFNNDQRASPKSFSQEVIEFEETYSNAGWLQDVQHIVWGSCSAKHKIENHWKCYKLWDVRCLQANNTYIKNTTGTVTYLHLHHQEWGHHLLVHYYSQAQKCSFSSCFSLGCCSSYSLWGGLSLRQTWEVEGLSSFQ